MAVTQYTPISPVGKCKTCGKEFGQIIGRGKWRTYCSQACVPPKPAPTKLCELDGCGNIARSNANKYCEKHYYQVRRNGRIGTLVACALPCDQSTATATGSRPAKRLRRRGREPQQQGRGGSRELTFCHGHRIGPSFLISTKYEFRKWPDRASRRTCLS